MSNTPGDNPFKTGCSLSGMFYFCMLLALFVVAPLMLSLLLVLAFNWVVSWFA